MQTLALSSDPSHSLVESWDPTPSSLPPRSISPVSFGRIAPRDSSEVSSFTTQADSADALYSYGPRPFPRTVSFLAAKFATGKLQQPFADPIFQQLQAKVNRVSLPRRWAEEGVIPPSQDCKEKAFKFCKLVYQRSYLIPDRVSASKEEGIYMVYRHFYSSRSLSAEIDNDLDVICQVYDETQTFQTLMIEDFNVDFPKLLRDFNA